MFFLFVSRTVNSFGFERKPSPCHHQQHHNKRRNEILGKEFIPSNLSLGNQPFGELYQLRQLSQFHLDRRKSDNINFWNNHIFKSSSSSHLNGSSSGGFPILRSFNSHQKYAPLNYQNRISLRSFRSSAIFHNTATETKPSETLSAEEKPGTAKSTKPKEVLRAEEKSRVEEAVEAIKEKKQKVKDLAFEYGCSPEDLGAKIVEAPPKKTLWEKVKHEVNHYYNGFKLLYFEVKIAIRHLWRVMNGKSLTRRERRQVSFKEQVNDE